VILQAPVECGLFLLIRLFLSSRAAVIAENLFLRKQLALFEERRVQPRRSTTATRAFMVLLSRFLDWREALVIVKPETFLKWHGDPSSGITERQDKTQLCTLLMATQRSILESMFEAELYSVTYRTDECHGALKSIEVATTDASGHALSPSSVLQSTIDKLAQVKNAADRMRLEYLLLGSRMSLKERRQFDDYCVAAAP
jgi:hypothetical protein